MKIKLPLLIIVAGVLFTLYLQTQIPPDVYFSGDAGLKALLAQQLSTHWRFDLIPPAAQWVRTLWERGLYPYEEPFVYNVANRYYITFPFTFPLVTAPFYRLFGYRGLYAVPLISIWVTWFVFYWVCRRLQLNSAYTSVALVTIIFASPLTLYSAMYWEHTLAVALAFSGLALLFPVSKSIGKAIISGCLIGLSVWFRPEFLCMAVLMSIVVYLVPRSLVKYRTLRQIFSLSNLTNRIKLSFIASLFSTIGLFFIFNKLIYGYFLGIHAIQVVEDTALTQKLQNTINNFEGLQTALFRFLPIVYFVIFFLILYLLNKKIIRSTFSLAIIYLSCFLFILGVSFLVPPGTAGSIPGGKQWGPRFLLILVPIISLLVVKEFAYISKKAAPVYKYISIPIISLLLSVGIYRNTYLGINYLQDNYQGILPTVQFLNQSSTQAIAVSHQFVAQALEPSVQRKWFLKVEDRQDLVQLGAALVEQGKQSFLYLCYPYRSCELPEAAPETDFIQNNQKFTIKLSHLGEVGKYPIYKASIVNK